MRCWLCNIEPTEVYHVMTMDSDQPIAQFVAWPTGDHEHAEVPPTPEQIERAALDTLMRIRGESFL